MLKGLREFYWRLIIHMSSTGNAEEAQLLMCSAGVAAIRNANDCHPDLSTAMLQVRRSRNATPLLILEAE